MLRLPRVATIEVAPPMRPDEVTPRLRALLDPEQGHAPMDVWFESTGRIDGTAFRGRRVSRGMMTRFVVPEVCANIEETASGSTLRASVRPTLSALLPVLLVTGYAFARTGSRSSDARVWVPFAVALGLVLLVVSVFQEVGRARRFAQKLGVASEPSNEA